MTATADIEESTTDRVVEDPSQEASKGVVFSKPTAGFETASVAPTASSSASSQTGEDNDQPRQYRMVALDLDGTLLNQHHKLTEATKDYLRYLDERGFTIIFATGRAISTVYEHVLDLNLPHPLPVVCSNGAEGVLCRIVGNEHRNRAVSTEEETRTIVKEPLFYTPVPGKVAQRTIEMARDHGYVSQYYVQDDVYADPRKDHHVQLCEHYMKLTGCNTIYVKDDFELALQRGLPSKQLVLCPKNEQDDMMKLFETEFSKEEYTAGDEPLKPTMVRGWLGWFMEILNPKVCKGNGLIQMCQHLDIPIEECVAFGDGDNDYEFLSLAGQGYAMKNARDVVKEVADEVIDYTNREDGVVKTLQRLEKEDKLVLPRYVDDWIGFAMRMYG